MKESERTVFASVAYVKVLLFGFTALLANSTVLTHIAQISHLSFKQYALLSIVMALVVLFGVAIVSRKWLSEVTVNDQGVLFFILIIGIIGAILALIIHRPDSDDFYYVPNAVYYIQNSNMEMSFDIHFFHANGTSFVSHMTNTASPYEYMQAFIAYYIGAEYLFIYYMVFPAFVGIMIPLSLFYALSHFSSESSNNAVGVLITVGMILLLGETHRTIGNLSFARAFHGKCLFLSAGIPLFVAFSYDYFNKPSLLSWVCVFVISTSFIGMTSSAAVILPALASVLALAYLTTTDNLKHSFFFLILYFLALGYVLVYAIVISGYALSYAGVDSPQNRGWPTTFSGHLNFLINPVIPLTLAVAAVSTTASLLLCQKRKELFVWILASILLFLNPFAASLLIKYVTSPNIYWRMFYILPFPLIIGISVSCILSHLSIFVKGRRLIFLTLACFVSLIMLHYPLRKASVFRPANDVRIAWPRYKVETDDLLLAREVILIAPSGVMLAPANIAGMITMLSAKYPQMSSRFEGILTWLTYRGQSREAFLRIKASNFVAGDNSQFDSFKAIILMHPDLQSIVLVPSIWKRAEVQDFLNYNGFTSHYKFDHNYMLIWK